MAKGDVTIRFDANTAQYVQQMLAAKNALDATADSARKTSEHVAKGGEGFDKMAQSVKHLGTELLGAVGITLSMSAAIEAVSKTIETFHERDAKRAEEARIRAITLDRALGDVGRMGDAPRVRRDLEEFTRNKYGGRTFDAGAVEKQFAEIFAQGGHRFGTKAAVGGTEAALKGLAADMSPGAATQLGIGFSELSRLMPGASPEVIENLAYQLQTQAPGTLSDPKMLRFLARATNKTEALKAIVAASQSGESGRALTAVQNKMETRGMGGDFVAAINSPGLFTREERLDVAALRIGMSQVRPTGTLDEAIRTAVLNEGQAGTAVRIGENTASIAAKTVEKGGVAALNKAEIKKRAQALFEAEYPITSAIPGMGWIEQNLERPDFARGWSWTKPGYRERAITQMQNEQNHTLDGPEQRKHTEILRDISNKLGGGTILKNDSQGQK